MPVVAHGRLARFSSWLQLLSQLQFYRYGKGEIRVGYDQLCRAVKKLAQAFGEIGLSRFKQWWRRLIEERSTTVRQGWFLYLPVSAPYSYHLHVLPILQLLQQRFQCPLAIRLDLDRLASTNWAVGPLFVFERVRIHRIAAIVHHVVVE